MDHREQLPIGAELVGDYRIHGVLGQGGFGITYKAWHLGLKAPVAVKECFPTEFATRDNTLTVRPKSERYGEMFDWGRKRFIEEAVSDQIGLSRADRFRNVQRCIATIDPPVRRRSLVKPLTEAKQNVPSPSVRMRHGGVSTEHDVGIRTHSD